jgi:hypothetical protein
MLAAGMATTPAATGAVGSRLQQADKWAKIAEAIRIYGLFDSKEGRQKLAEQLQQQKRHHQEQAWLSATDPTGERRKGFEQAYGRKPTYPDDPLWLTFCMGADQFELDPTGEYRERFRREFGRDPHWLVDIEYRDFCLIQRFPQLIALAVQVFKTVKRSIQPPIQSPVALQEPPASPPAIYIRRMVAAGLRPSRKCPRSRPYPKSKQAVRL